jgi:2-polyprenyl-3-methyl-5-hydroxy-6-metoxy-1,4-benzoquinol methylase
MLLNNDAVAALNLNNHLQLTTASSIHEMKLLEVGCGSGLGTQLCSLLKPPNVTITAIDLSQVHQLPSSCPL